MIIVMGSYVGQPRIVSDSYRIMKMDNTLQFLQGSPRGVVWPDTMGNYDVNLVRSNCALLNGTSDVFYFTWLDEGTTIISYEGTATPVIDTDLNKITTTSGTLYNLRLSNGAVLGMAEGAGINCYDSSGNGYHASYTGGWGLQDTYHQNITVGFTDNSGVKVPLEPNHNIWNDSLTWDDSSTWNQRL